MISKLLIANRGEIACRVIATAHRLGIATVAVYSDADLGARHVAMADEAVRIGPPAAADSYLQGARIIEAALATGAQAIHPGYGFLSENPEFVEAVEAAGLIFVGPPASAIRAMGLKDAAKTLMVEAGVPVVPGYHGAEQDPAFLALEAEKIGYPVMIKARAGGGGKGMRLVERAQDFAAALEGAQREGLASFGDPACLIEKFIQNPRHIEIQVFGDAHGTVVHLFERDCSLQRRHQKVIEEAPAPGMTDDLRAAMGQAAVEAAKAIGYTGAGTVEFIVDGSGPLRSDGFWFMEMNTRLQVEHPVSEAITGLDFVELQLRVAAGAALPVTQSDLRISGHAFEARVYAEDVPKGFLPATGTLEHLSFPLGTAFTNGPARIDSGVRQGDVISPWYDPMIAKVVVHGPTRAAALAQLKAALAGCHVAGSVTNLGFLHALSRDPDFANGDVDTGLIARKLKSLTTQIPPSPQVTGLAAYVALGLDGAVATAPWTALRGWRAWGQAGAVADLGGREIAVTFAGDDRFEIDGVGMTIAATSDGFRVDGQRLAAVRTSDAVTVFDSGAAHVFDITDPLAASGDAVGGDAITAPMPGLVKSVAAQVGQSVIAGEAMMVLEAMKMEHTLRAPRDGVIAEVMASVSDQVSDGALLIALEPET